MAKLTNTEFTILRLVDREGPSTDEELYGCNMPLDQLRSSLKHLEAKEYLHKDLNGRSSVTLNGYSALEPYRVRRAIFLAAGYGSRLLPITRTVPKPLVKVNGTRIIDTLLDAVLGAGINEIVIVRGYLGEQFDQLLEKYPTVQFVDNPLYEKSNNIYSALLVRNLIRNAYVMESDLYLKNPSLIQKYEYETNYLSSYVQKTDDWCFRDDGGIITWCGIGGENCHRMWGISYWSCYDASMLAHDLLIEYTQPGGEALYWDQVALQKQIRRYKVAIRSCDENDIVEIDSYRDLQTLENYLCNQLENQISLTKL